MAEESANYNICINRVNNYIHKFDDVFGILQNNQYRPGHITFFLVFFFLLPLFSYIRVNMYTLIINILWFSWLISALLKCQWCLRICIQSEWHICFHFHFLNFHFLYSPCFFCFSLSVSLSFSVFLYDIITSWTLQALPKRHNSHRADASLCWFCCSVSLCSNFIQQV